ncbi:elongation factor P--(R)-beta-lysine ligase [Glaciecola sp. 1036]|uniref:elongation factor P--(R)-beta-lysine ligase n=1 Tax=Alteromonadaceae TaxID=72275 RepID=UPI003CFC4BBD
MGWYPSSDIEMLHTRAAFLSNIREFFKQREVLEVDVPALSRGTVTDVFLEALETQHQLPGSQESTLLYLQTSPEFYMKRLLAAGSGDIFYLGKSYRNDEVGRHHSPEFTMLEWYRCGFSMQQLIDEISALVNVLLGISSEQITYQQVFQNLLGFNPLSVSLEDMLIMAERYDLLEYAELLKTESSDSQYFIDSLLQVLFNRHIEPKIGQDKPVIVTHFPASQASLAKLSGDKHTALRFEMYFKQLELANGFEELTDSKEQAIRFKQDNKQRKKLNKQIKPIDHAFLSALESGLPECSGVAIGVDRLLMLKTGKPHIRQVLPFSLYD